jgi:hypothetical protein
MLEIGRKHMLSQLFFNLIFCPEPGFSNFVGMYIKIFIIISNVSKRINLSSRFSLAAIQIISSKPTPTATNNPVFVPQIASAAIKTKSGIKPGNSFFRSSVPDIGSFKSVNCLLLFLLGDLGGENFIHFHLHH